MSENFITLQQRDALPQTKLYVEYHRAETNSSKRSTIIFHTGGPGNNATVFENLVDPVMKFADVVLFDPRGCGRSEKANVEHCTLEHHIDDLEALRTTLNIENCILFGMSYGGMVASGYGCKYHKNLAGLVICCSAATGEAVHQARENLKRMGTPEQIAYGEKLWHGTIETKEEMIEYSRLMDPLTRVRQQFEYTIRRDIPFNLKLLNYAVKHYMFTFNFEDDLHKITCPTLVLAGEKDWICDPIFSERIAERIPNSKLIIYPETGHMINIERFPETISALNEFVSTLEL